MAKCIPTPDGTQLILTEHEIHVLRFLGRELRRLLEHGDPEHKVMKPFFPEQQRGADPEAVSTGLDSDMDAAVMEHRLERIESVQESLLINVDEEEGGLNEVFTTERLDTWLAYLTDLRLLVSAVVGITPEDPDPFPTDPTDWTLEQEMYLFLTALQEGLLESIQGDDGEG